MRWLAVLLAASATVAACTSALIADREMIERGFYNHQRPAIPLFRSIP